MVRWSGQVWWLNNLEIRLNSVQLWWNLTELGKKTAKVPNCRQVGYFLAILFLRKKFGHKFSGQVGQILMSIPIKVCKIPNMVMVGMFFLWFGRDFFIFKVIPEKILHLKVSLVKFNLNINQQNPNKSEKMYVKNFLDRQGEQTIRVLVQTYLCPYQDTRQVGQTDICPNFRSFFLEGFPKLDLMLCSFCVYVLR